MNIKVRIAEEKELKNWNLYVKSSPYGTIFHTLDWLRIAEKHTNSKLYPLIGLKGEKVIGIFPLFYMRKGLLRMVFSPPPKTGIPYMGPVLLGYDELKQDKKESLILNFVICVDKFIHDSFKPHYIYIKLPPGLLDCRPFKWLGYYASPVYSYLLDISKGLSVIESNISMQARKNIRKAEQVGLTIELGNKEELLILYNMLNRRYIEQKRKIPISEDYLLDVFNSLFPENLKIFVLRYKDKIISGGVKLCYKDKVTDWIGQAKTKIRTSNDFLHWSVIKWGIENRYRYYEIIGANTLSICQFKSKFNPALSVYFCVKKATLAAIIAEKLYMNVRKHR